MNAPRRRRRNVTALAAAVVLAVVAVVWRSETATRDARHVGPIRVAAAGPANAAHDAPSTDAASTTTPSIDTARAAALEVVASSGVLVRSGPIGRRDLLRRLFTSDALAAQITELDHETDVLATRLGVNPISLTWLEQPLTARAESTSTGARVSVWSTVVFGTDAAPTGGRATSVPTVMWRTSVIDLAWRDGHWQVSAMTATAGPTPSLDDAAAVDGFARFRDVAGWPAVVAGVES